MMIKKANIKLEAALALVLVFLSGCRSTEFFRVKNLEFQEPSARLQGEAAAQKKIHPAECLWKGQSEIVSLGWDAIAKMDMPSSNISELQACTNAEPLSGTPLVLEGKKAQIPRWRSVLGEAKLYACSGSTELNPYNECRVQDSGCTEIRRPCHFEEPNYPYCQEACELKPSRDTTFKIAMDRGLNGVPVSGLFKPAYAVIEGSRPLARRANLNAGLSDAAGGKYLWEWTAQERDGSIWNENFSPKLLISKVRAFIPDPETEQGRRYLKLSKISTDLGPLYPCSPDPSDPSEFNGNSCMPLLAFTPAYRRGTPDHGVIWRIETNAADNPGLDASSRVMIEFTVNNTLGNSAYPVFSPSEKDLGRIHVNVAEAFRAGEIFKMENTQTGEAWTVTSVSLEGPQAGDFSLDLQGRTPPFDVKPGGAVRAAIGLNASSPGEKNAMMRMDLRSVSKRKKTFIGRLHAVVVAPHLIAQPDSLQLKLRLSAAISASRDILIKNTGSAPAERRRISLNGSDAKLFHLASDLSSQRPSVFTLEPGESEMIKVIFTPSEEGIFYANVSIDTDSGALNIPVKGESRA